MAKNCRITYCIKELKNGLLIDPEDMFVTWGYDSEEEALEDIMSKELHRDFVVLKSARYSEY